MSATKPAVSHTWQVGRYTATLSIPRLEPGVPVSCLIEWSPHMPKRLTPQEMKAYRAGRDAAIRELQQATLVVDLK